MAEFVFKDMVKKKKLEEQFIIASSATSTEEIGNPVHHVTRNKLKFYGITTEGKRAVQLKKTDYDNYDYILGMEERNIANMIKICGQDKEHKIKRLLDFSDRPRDIEDPWYTGNFDVTYDDIYAGCQALLEYILRSNK